MSQTLHLDLRASLAWLLQDSGPLAAISESSKLECLKTLPTGTGAAQVDRIWHDQRTVAAGASDDLDLTALVRQVFGQNISTNFAAVKAILLVNQSTITGDDLAVGGAGASAFSAPFNADDNAQLMAPADSVLLLANTKLGWPVIAGTAHVLRVHNPAASAVEYAIVIAGTSV